MHGSRIYTPVYLSQAEQYDVFTMYGPQDVKFHLLSSKLLRHHCTLARSVSVAAGTRRAAFRVCATFEVTGLQVLWKIATYVRFCHLLESNVFVKISAACSFVSVLDADIFCFKTSAFLQSCKTGMVSVNSKCAKDKISLSSLLSARGVHHLMTNQIRLLCKIGSLYQGKGWPKTCSNGEQACTLE